MYDLITVGNISIDIYYQGNSITYKNNRFQLAIGGKYFVENIVETVGGGAANIAIGVAKQGLKTAIQGTIGYNPFKKIITDKLTEYRVSLSHCNFKENFLNISTIILNDKGEKSVLHYTTPHQKITENEDELNSLCRSHYVYFGNLPDVSLTDKIYTLHYLKKHNTFIIANFGVKDCRRSKDQLLHLLKNIDILMINGHEFADLVKAAYNDIHFHDNIVNWYIPYFKNKILIITEGEKGSYGYMNNKVYHQKAISPKKILDTTGAGDGFCAGFIANYFHTNQIENAMNAGAHYAAKILAKIGAN